MQPSLRQHSFYLFMQTLLWCMNTNMLRKHVCKYEQMWLLHVAYDKSYASSQQQCRFDNDLKARCPWWAGSYWCEELVCECFAWVHIDPSIVCSATMNNEQLLIFTLHIFNTYCPFLRNGSFLFKIIKSIRLVFKRLTLHYSLQSLHVCRLGIYKNIDFSEVGNREISK